MDRKFRKGRVQGEMLAFDQKASELRSCQRHRRCPGAIAPQPAVATRWPVRGHPHCRSWAALSWCRRPVVQGQQQGIARLTWTRQGFEVGADHDAFAGQGTQPQLVMAVDQQLHGVGVGLHRDLVVRGIASEQGDCACSGVGSWSGHRQEIPSTVVLLIELTATTGVLRLPVLSARTECIDQLLPGR